MLPRSRHLRPFAAFALAAASVLAHAQFAGAPQQETTPVHDTSALHPPPGARVAIVEFEDQECPDCARANPLLRQASEQYHIPWVRHDFPLPQHGWSFEAAVNARWFDTKSRKLGSEYRDAVFANQQSITVINPDGMTENGEAGLANLRAFTQKWASEHGIAFPFVVDPQKKLAAEVKADYALGQRIGIQHTPTIWIVTNQTKGTPFVEVVNRDRLYSMIEEALAETRASAPTGSTATRASVHHP
jgi:protein-disulfide isomerase